MGYLYFAVPLYTKAKTSNLHKSVLENHWMKIPTSESHNRSIQNRFIGTFKDFSNLNKFLTANKARTEKLQKHFLATKDLWQANPPR